MSVWAQFFIFWNAKISILIRFSNSESSIFNSKTKSNSVYTLHTFQDYMLHNYKDLQQTKIGYA